MVRRRLAWLTVALALSVLLSGCTLEYWCEERWGQWRQTGLYESDPLADVRASDVGASLPFDGSGAAALWPGAALEGVTWIPGAPQGPVDEGTSGSGYHDRTMLHVFADRDVHAPRAVTPTGQRGLDGDGPVVAIAIAEPGSPADERMQLLRFLLDTGYGDVEVDGLIENLSADREFQSGIVKGETFRKWIHWHPVEKRSMTPLIDALDARMAVVGHSRVGWLHVDWPPEWRLTFEVPTKTLVFEENQRVQNIVVDSAGGVKAMSTRQYYGDEQEFRDDVRRAFAQAGLPAPTFEDFRSAVQYDC